MPPRCRRSGDGHVRKHHAHELASLARTAWHIISSAISAVHTIAPAARTPLGAIIENQTAIELARGGQPLAGWKRSSAGSEIDFIVKTGQTAVPVECKASLTANLRHMRGLIAYLGSHGQRRGYIASLAPYAETNVDGVQIVNLAAYLLERLVSGVR